MAFKDFEYIRILIDSIGEKLEKKGGPGSGHFDHAGRPGKVGGSLPADESYDPFYHDFDPNAENVDVEKLGYIPKGRDVWGDRLDKYTDKDDDPSVLDKDGKFRVKKGENLVFSGRDKDYGYEYIGKWGNEFVFAPVLPNKEDISYGWGVLVYGAEDIAEIVGDGNLVRDVDKDYLPRKRGDVYKQRGTGKIYERVGNWGNDIVLSSLKDNDVEISFDEDELLEVFEPLGSGKSVDEDLEAKGGPGSGFFNHAGRPGKVGGSQHESGGTPEKYESNENLPQVAVEGTSPRELLKRTFKKGGLTYHPLKKTFATGNVFIVSPWEDRELELSKEDFTWQRLKEYIHDNRKLIRNNHNSYIGTWHDVENKRVFLDCVVALTNEDDARQACIDHKQISYYSVARDEVVTVNKDRGQKSAESKGRVLFDFVDIDATDEELQAFVENLLK